MTSIIFPVFFTPIPRSSMFFLYLQHVERHFARPPSALQKGVFRRFPEYRSKLYMFRISTSKFIYPTHETNILLLAFVPVTKLEMEQHLKILH